MYPGAMLKSLQYSKKKTFVCASRSILITMSCSFVYAAVYFIKHAFELTDFLPGCVKLNAESAYFSIFEPLCFLCSLFGLLELAHSSSKEIVDDLELAHARAQMTVLSL